MLLNWRLVRSVLLIFISTFALNRSRESVINRNQQPPKHWNFAVRLRLVQRLWLCLRVSSVGVTAFIFETTVWNCSSLRDCTELRLKTAFLFDSCNLCSPAGTPAAWYHFSDKGTYEHGRECIVIAANVVYSTGSSSHRNTEISLLD